MWQEKERGCRAVYSLSFPMILIRNVKEKEGGMFIFSIMAGLCSRLSVCAWYSALFRQAIVLRGEKTQESIIFIIYSSCTTILYRKERKQTSYELPEAAGSQHQLDTPVVFFHVLPMS